MPMKASEGRGPASYQKHNRFSPISPVPRMHTGLLFLTSISYTDPDQFVYKTRPPRERPDTSPDVRMNSYLGL